MVYDGVHNPAAGDTDPDICSHGYSCADTNAHSDRADPYTSAGVNRYTYASANANADTDACAEWRLMVSDR